MLILKNRTTEYIYWIDRMRSYITPEYFECGNATSDHAFLILGVVMYPVLFQLIHPSVAIDQNMQQAYINFRNKFAELEGRGFRTVFFYERAVKELLNKEDFCKVMDFIRKYDSFETAHLIDIGIQSVDQYHLFPIRSYPLGLALCRAHLAVMGRDLNLPHIPDPYGIESDVIGIYYEP
jgi:hypothetical protein